MENVTPATSPVMASSTTGNRSVSPNMDLIPSGCAGPSCSFQNVAPVPKINSPTITVSKTRRGREMHSQGSSSESDAAVDICGDDNEPTICNTKDICILCGDEGQDNELWYRCTLCSEWAHAECTGFDSSNNYECKLVLAQRCTHSAHAARTRNQSGACECIAATHERAARHPLHMLWRQLHNYVSAACRQRVAPLLGMLCEILVCVCVCVCDVLCGREVCVCDVLCGREGSTLECRRGFLKSSESTNRIYFCRAAVAEILSDWRHSDLAFHWLLLRFRRVEVAVSGSSGCCDSSLMSASPLSREWPQYIRFHPTPLWFLLRAPSVYSTGQAPANLQHFIHATNAPNGKGPAKFALLFGIVLKFTVPYILEPYIYQSRTKNSKEIDSNVRYDAEEISGTGAYQIPRAASNNISSTVEWPITFEEIKQICDVDYSAEANETTRCGHLFIRLWSLSSHRKITRISQLSFVFPRRWNTLEVELYQGFRKAASNRERTTDAHWRTAFLRQRIGKCTERISLAVPFTSLAIERYGVQWKDIWAALNIGVLNVDEGEVSMKQRRNERPRRESNTVSRDWMLSSLTVTPPRLLRVTVFAMLVRTAAWQVKLGSQPSAAPVSQSSVCFFVRQLKATHSNPSSVDSSLRHIFRVTTEHRDISFVEDRFDGLTDRKRKLPSIGRRSRDRLTDGRLTDVTDGCDPTFRIPELGGERQSAILLSRVLFRFAIPAIISLLCSSVPT
ncbi:hypothetical protein PR048_030295 [Dryococelus australis]|uniref:Zinc finger PHD-type domain-containing protein n=1 Tax=Dryococelus australis TaxID=614101 RepID=A0ABQ9G8K8_9NEOP|nr:hypothetical protein PR048_030295 [Dryococelus australis]